MTLNRLKSSVHARLLIMRSIDRIVNSSYFESIYNEASLNEKQYAELMINSLNLSALKAWMKKQGLKSPDLMTIGELRALASCAFIPNYTTLRKSVLIGKLMEAGIL